MIGINGRRFVLASASVLLLPHGLSAQGTDPFTLRPEFVSQAIFSCSDALLNGNATVDSIGVAGSTGATAKGHLVSNGSITVNGAAVVRGDVTAGPGKQVVKNGNPTITGKVGNLTAAWACNPVNLTTLAASLAAANDNAKVPKTSKGNDPLHGSAHKDFSLNANESVTLPAGTYYFTSLIVNGGAQLLVSPTTRILCTGQVVLNGNASVNASGNPFALRIWSSGSELTVNGGAVLRAVYYSSQSASNIVVNGGGRVWGSLYGGRVTVNGGATVSRAVDDSPAIAIAIAVTEGGKALADGVLFARNVTPVIAVSGGASPVTTQATLDGLSFASGTVVSAEGTHRLVVIALDASAATASVSIAFTIDKTSPRIAIVSPVNGSVSAVSPVDVYGTADDAISVTVNGRAATVASGTFAAKGVSLTEGSNTLTATGLDAAGNAGTATSRVILDTSAPTLSITAPADGLVTTASTVTVAGTASDASLSSLLVNGSAVAETGGAFTASVPLAEGANSITVEARDAAGHLTIRTVRVERDTTPPVIRITDQGSALTDGALFGRDVTPQIVVTDARATTVTATLDGIAYISETVVQAEGAHTLAVAAKDVAGNQASLSLRFTIDRTPPAVAITYPTAGNFIGSLPARVAGTCGDAVSVSVNGTAAAVSAGQFVVASYPYPEGAVSLTAIATDAAGNGATSTVACIVDTRPPVVTITSPATGVILGPGPILLSGTAVDANLKSVTVDGVAVSVGVDGTFQSGPLVRPDGPATLGAVAIDQSGKSASASVSVVVDTAPPVISILNAATGAPLADGSPFRAPVTVSVTVADATTQAAITRSILVDGAPYGGGPISGEGAHRVDVTARDGAGNSATAAVSFTVDTVPPSFSDLVPADGTVTKSSPIAMSGKVSLDATEATVNGRAASLATGSFVLSGLALVEGPNALALRAVDRAGNVGTATLQVVLDTAPPQISIGSPSPGQLLGSLSASVTGTVSDPNLESVSVESGPASVTGSSFRRDGVTLVEGSNTLTAIARDRAGNATMATVSVVVDTKPPVLTVTSPTPGTMLGATPVTVTGTAIDPNLASVTVNGVAAVVGAGGQFTASIPVNEGTNVLAASARDMLGHESAASVSVILDSAVPVVTITSPRDGTLTRGTTIAVAGTLDSAMNVAGVTVNGAAAVLNGTSFSAMASLIEGPNPITARATKSSGKEGTAGITVTRDTTPPRLVSSVPADGQSGVALTPALRLTFSEAIDPATVASPAIDLRDGTTAIPLAVSVVGAVVTLTPNTALRDSGIFVLTLNQGIQDLAGNPLAVTTVRFTTVDLTPPGDPALDGLPGAVCASTVAVKGSAEAGATIAIAGGAALAQGTVGPDGRFSVDVLLTPESRQTLSVTARDSSGNVSTPSTVTVTADCTPPQVVDVTRAAGALTIRFSEALRGSTLRAGETIRLDPSGGAPISPTLSLSADGTVVTAAVSAVDLTTIAFTLSLSAGLTDAAGNALSPFVRSFAPTLVATVLTGEVYDDSIGRPLSGATVTVLFSGGQPATDPKPTATSSQGGLFSVPVFSGDALVRLSASGFLPVYRRQSIQAGASGEAISAALFDSRLTPQAPAAVPAATSSGVRHTSQRPSRLASAILDSPTGALPAGAVVQVTVRRPQGLPVLAPLGWSVATACNLSVVDASGAAISPAGSLTLTLPDFYGASSSTSLAAAHLDPVSLQWLYDGPASLQGKEITLATAAVGDFAVLVPDPLPTGPPTPTIGSPLQDVAMPAEDPLVSAMVVADPVDVVPSQIAEVSLSVVGTGPVPSGYPVQALVTEQLTLLDESTVSSPAFLSDLVLGMRGDGSMGLSIPVRASYAASQVALSVGYERFAVRTFPFEVRRGIVIGASGGTVTGPSGWSLTLPAGAVQAPTSVMLTPLGASDLPVQVPAGFDLVGAVSIGTGAAPFASAASLAVVPSVDPVPGQDLVLVQFTETRGLVALRPVARATWTAASRTVQTAPIDRSRFPWPGVTGEGTYAFLSAHDPLAFAAGRVLDIDGSALASVRVDAAGWPLVALTGNDGNYATAIRAIATTLSSVNPVTANGGSLTVSPASRGQEMTGLDLHLAITAPFVAAVTPAAGSTVLVSSSFTVDFSEPVDPLSVTAGSFFLAAGLAGSSTQAALVPGKTDLAPGGRSVSFVPSASLAGNTPLVLHVGKGIKDLTGYGLVDRATGLPADLDVTYTTEDLTPPDTKPWLVTITPPSGIPGDPTVTIRGAAGAVCAGCLVTAFNDTTLATASANALSDGSFSLVLHAKATDTIRIEVSKQNGTRQTLPSVPFSSDGGRAVSVGASGGIWQTPEGYRIEVPKGAFPSGQTVVTTRGTQADLEALVQAPREMSFVDSFVMEFDTPATAGFDFSFPAPAVGTPTDQFVLVEVVEVFGERRLMVVDLLGRKDGRLVTDRSGLNLQALKAAGWVALVDVASSPGPSGRPALSIAPKASIGFSASTNGTQTDRPSSFWDGVFKRGRYALYNAATLMTYVAGPSSGAALVATSSSSDFVFSGMDVLTRDTFRLVVAAGRSFRLALRDSSTGYTLFDGDVSPSSSPATVTLVNPPLAVDTSPPGILAAEPAFVRRFNAPPAGTSIAASSLVSGTAAAIPNGPGVTVSLSGVAGASPKKARLRLVNFSRPTAAGEAIASRSDGSFSGLAVSASPGDRLGLIVENTGAPPSGPITIRFDKPMAAGNAWSTLISLTRATSKQPVPVHGVAVPTAVPGDPAVVREVRFFPDEAFSRGEGYSLSVSRNTVDATPARSPMAADFVAFFSSGKPASAVDQTTGFVRKVLHRGGLVFETGEDNQVHVYDASTMGGGSFQTECDVVALPGTGRDMTFDGFGRLVVVGGGSGGLGFLKLFDLNAGGACPRKVLTAAGAAVVSNEVGSELLDYPPDGLPKRVSILQSAETTTWTAGTDESKNPALTGIVISPSGAQQTYRSPLSVRSKPGREITPSFTGQRYRRAVLTDETTGESVRQTLDVSGGSATFSLALQKVTPGDRLRLEISTASFAVVDVLGHGLAMVDLEATYLRGSDAPPDTTRPGIDTRLAVVYDGSGAPGPKQPGLPPSCDAAQRISSDWTVCELFVPPPAALPGFPAINDLLSLSDAVTHPVPNADGTVSLFGTLTHFGLVSFNLDLLGRSRLHPLNAAQLFPLSGSDPVIVKDHKIGITGLLPLLPAGSVTTGIGAARAVALALAPAWRRRAKPLYCTDSLWSAGDPREARDLAFVAAGANGVFVVDVTEPRAARKIGLLPTAGGALTVSIDAVRKLLYVGDAGAGVKVYDVSDPCGELGALASGDDPRLVASFQFGAGGNPAGTSDIPVEVDPDTGFALASANETAGTSGRLSAYQIGAPPLYTVADTDLDGQFEMVTGVVPLGVRNPDKDAAVGPDPRSPTPSHTIYVPDHFRVLAHLPGGAGGTVEAEVASTGPEGTDLPPSSPGFPPTGFVSSSPVLLRRQSDDPSEPAFNRYLSDPIVVLADPRAQLAYARTGAEKNLPGEQGAGNPNACQNCDLAGDLERAVISSGTPGNSTARRLELWAGDRIRISLAESVKANLSYLAEVDLRAAGITLGSVRGDLIPALRPRPLLSGNSVAGISTHSGEYAESAVDLAVPGRALNLAVDRTYSSQSIHQGPFGRNVDSSLFERLRPRPARGADGRIYAAGEVDWFDGSARRVTFVWQTTTSRYDSPAGVASTLLAGSDGRLFLQSPDLSVTTFDEWGRKLSFEDRHVTKADGSDGNRHRFVRDGAGRLVAVEDDLGRRFVLGYDASGRLTDLTDFDGRTVTYAYDDLGRLASFRGPSPDGPGSKRTGPLASSEPAAGWEYSLATPQSDLATLLKSAPQIRSVTDGNGSTPVRIDWDAARPGSARQVTTVDGASNITVDSQTGITTVTDPRAATTTFTHDPDGHVTAEMDPLGNTTSYTYTGGSRPDGTQKPDGLLASVTLPGGQITTFKYESDRTDRRSQFNLREQRRKPGIIPGQQVPADLITLLEQYSHGSPGRITSPDGSITSVVRNDRGDPTTIARTGTSLVNLGVDPYGRVTALDQQGRREERTYDAVNGQLYTVSVAGAGTTTYFRDARGNATSVRDASGNTTTYEVDRLDRITKETRGGGPGAGVTAYAYDANSQVTRRSSVTGYDADGKAISSVADYAYDSLGRMTSRTSSASGTTTYAYDGQGNLATAAAPGGRVTGYRYDLRGLLTGIQGQVSQDCPAGSLTQFAYDPNGTRTSSTSPAGATTTYSLDGHDRVIGSLGALGAYTSAPPDAGGRVPVTKVMDRDAQGSPSSIHRWSEQQYDLAGRVIKEIRKLFVSPIPATGTPAAADAITETRYDDAGRVIDTVDPLGRITHSDYDEAGRTFRVTDPAGNQTVNEYDAAGRTRKTTVRELRPDGGYDEFVTGYGYDDQGRVVTLTAPGNRVTTYEYDAAGRKTKETGPDGATRRSFYDLAGRKVRELDPIGAETKWEYDEAGNLAKLTDANGNVTSFLYDAEGRLVTETRPDGKTWTRKFDCAGNEASITTPTGVVVRRSYDLEGRLTARSASGGMLPRPVSETITYDLLGRAVRKTASGEGADVETRLAFDSLDRLLGETTKIGTGPDRTVTRAFDLAGNAVQITYPSGRAYTLAVDPLDRLRSISRQTGAGSIPIAVWTDVGSRQARKTLGSGLVETRTYSAEPWLQSIDVRPSGAATPLLGIDYSQRTPAGYKADVTRLDRSRRNHYVYDLAGRITNEQLGFLVPPPAPPAANLPAIDAAYTLDPVLNVKKLDRTEAGATQPIAGTVDARNRVTQWGGDTPAWDADGNLTGWKGRSLSYGIDDRLTKATLPNGDTVEFLHDADGRKVREARTAGGTKVETDLVQAGQQIVETYPKDGASPSAVFVHGRGIDEVVQAEIDPIAGGTTTSLFPVQDELGNVTHLTDQNGNVLERYDYEGYGKFRIFDPQGTALSTSAYGWTRLFQGREYIPMLDAYDFRARTLWPELGRFGQEDPARSDPRLSLYQGLNGNWTNVTDPSGLYSTDFHFYAVYYLARAAGLRRENARKVAWASQYVDDHPDTSASVLNTIRHREQLAAFHFLAPGQESVKRLNGIAVQNMARAKARGNLVAVGVALHSLADTFSHEGFSAWWDPLRNRRTDGPVPTVGHGDAPEGGNYPDKPYHDVEKAVAAAKQCFEELETLEEPEGRWLNPRRSWTDVSRRIAGVFAASPGRVEPGWAVVGLAATKFWNDVSAKETEARSDLWRRLIRRDFLEDVHYEPFLGFDSLGLFEEEASAQRDFVLKQAGWR